MFVNSKSVWEVKFVIKLMRCKAEDSQLGRLRTQWLVSYIILFDAHFNLVELLPYVI